MAFRKLHIDWRKKVLAFWMFDRMPWGEEAYLWTQKRITKTVPRVLSPTSETAHCFVTHVEAFRKHYAGDLDTARLFEFGGGWDLYSNLVLWSLGINDQIVYDIRRWVRAEHINDVIAHLQHDRAPGAVRTPVQAIAAGAEERDLKGHYGITYRAPADARKTGMASGSIDLIATNSVLEHIPVTTLVELMAECYRLSHSGTVISHIINYSDHYAHSDGKITEYNFLQFSDDVWTRYNPGIHYQNRLRHCDYLALFKSHGFEIITVSAEEPPEARTQLASVKLAPPFTDYSIDELAPTIGYFVLRRA